MASNWRETTLGEVIELKRGYDLPQRERKPGSVPLVSSSGVSDKLSEAKVKGPGVVTGRYGTIGQVFFIDEDFWPLNTTLYVRDFKGNDPRFVSYFLRGINFGAYTDKAAVPGVNRNDLHRAEVVVPAEVKTQRGIAGVLGAIDDRIDNLRQTNTTLEAIAQALFKSWFVDFDPVRAKAEGREPEGMDAATAALFPSEFEDSELGPIPKGWPIRIVGDVASIVRGRSYKSAELADSDTALVTLKSFNRGGGFRRDGFKSYTGLYKPDQEVFEGDCIVSHTDVTQQAELIGRSAVVTASPLHSRLVASLDVGIIRPKTDAMTSLFLAALLSGDRYVSHIKGYTSGTTVLHLSKDGLPNFKFACPPSNVVEEFSVLAQAFFGRQATNIATQENLAVLRDTLLPRLISGKLRLPEAETILEDALA